MAYICDLNNINVQYRAVASAIIGGGGKGGGGGVIFIYSAQLISFEIDCFYGL